MVDMPIEKRIAERLEAIANDEGRPLNEVLDDMLEQYQPPKPPARKNWAREMARMAEEDTTEDWDNLSPDLAARSREILEQEFAEHLARYRSKTDTDG